MNNQNNSLWELQKDGKWKTLTNHLTSNSELLSHLNNLLKTAYKKFTEQKDCQRTEISFLGFGSFADLGQTGGYCNSDIIIKTDGDEKTYSGTLTINLNQNYLLDKLGMDKYYISSRRFYPVDFEQLSNTIAHELAHAVQTTINLEKENPRSQCESTGNKSRYPQLCSEHTSLTSEIRGMIVGLSEYQKFNEWWNKDRTQYQEVKETPSERERERAILLNPTLQAVQLHRIPTLGKATVPHFPRVS